MTIPMPNDIDRPKLNKYPLECTVRLHTLNSSAVALCLFSLNRREDYDQETDNWNA